LKKIELLSTSELEAIFESIMSTARPMGIGLKRDYSLEVSEKTRIVFSTSESRDMLSVIGTFY
jgi:hypothetical protein